VPRALPDGLGVELDPGAWVMPPVFAVIQALTEASDAEMRRTFNGGLGMVWVTAPDAAEGAVEAARSRGFGAAVVGRVTDRPGVRTS
jgi:phosphoribosylformylglycinamidine cyclo-ligase